jgi:hypothetical protein
MQKIALLRAPLLSQHEQEKGKEMSTSSSIRSLLFFMTLLVSLVALSGCLSHHGQGPSTQTEQSAVLHEGHETTTVQPVASEALKPDQQHQHESRGMMSMMHDSGGWHWIGMGMMMAVMVLIVL